MPHAVIGIDLGTTNSALAWAEPRGADPHLRRAAARRAGEIARRPTLPSFLYFTDRRQRDAGSVRLPWDATPEVVAGVFARDQGALVPARQIASAKSWLSNPRVDRTAALLPWGAEEGRGCRRSRPRRALLAHLRDAWNHEHARHETRHSRLEQQQIVLTVPASFDEEARELTVEAAQSAGLDAAHPARGAAGGALRVDRRASPPAARTFAGRRADAGLRRRRRHDRLQPDPAQIEDGELAFERIAIGEHLLLGGDNLDLALAVAGRAEAGRLGQADAHPAADAAAEVQRREGAAAVASGRRSRRDHDARQRPRRRRRRHVDRADPRRGVRHADRRVPADHGSRRRAGARSARGPARARPAVRNRTGDHAAPRGISHARWRGTGRRHGAARRGAVQRRLLHAGARARRVLDALAAWFGARPAVLENEAPEAAVAVGAAFYGRLRRDPGAAKRLLIRAGSARVYYIGVDVEASRGHGAVCVMPRGTEEGTRFELDREFTVITNQPAAFTLYSSTTDGPGRRPRHLSMTRTSSSAMRRW